MGDEASAGLADGGIFKREGVSMQVKDVMTRRIVSVAPEESAAVAARLLARYNVGALPVCTAEGRLKGVVTDRDIVLRCVAAEEEPSRTKISEIMTRRVVSVDAGEQAEAAAQIMAREQIRRLPVEENGKLVGMVSLGDLAVVPDFSTEAASALCEISANEKRL